MNDLYAYAIWKIYYDHYKYNDLIISSQPTLEISLSSIADFDSIDILFDIKNEDYQNWGPTYSL